MVSSVLYLFLAAAALTTALMLCLLVIFLCICDFILLFHREKVPFPDLSNVRHIEQREIDANVSGEAEEKVEYYLAQEDQFRNAVELTDVQQPSADVKAVSQELQRSTPEEEKVGDVESKDSDARSPENTRDLLQGSTSSLSSTNSATPEKSNLKKRRKAKKTRKHISWEDEVEYMNGRLSPSSANERQWQSSGFGKDGEEELESDESHQSAPELGSLRSITEEVGEDEYFRELYESDETDEEFYRRIFMDWDLQDRLTRKPPSWLSTMLYFPILVSLRVVQSFVKLIIKLTRTVLQLTRIFSMSNGREQEDSEHDSYLSSLETRLVVDDIPFEQKKQAATVFFFLSLMPLIFVAYSFTFMWLVFPLTTLPMLAYLLFIFKLDTSPEDGSRIAFMRYWSVWRHFVNYFPIRLVKTANLDPQEKYVLCYHPHGIISFGAFGNFATDATGFSRLFPGISLRLLTLSQNFYVPWLREILLSMGVCSCSKRSCNNNLQRGPGSAIMLVVGGADESLLAAPGTYRLNVNCRKGFVRVAIDNGANLVPVLGFGENDAFTTHVYQEGSTLKTVQDEFKRRFGFATPIFWGRTLENSSTFGILPHRTPIIAVVGKPLKCPHVPAHLKGNKLRTTAEGRAIVNKYHEQYIKALKALYDAFKDKWAINRSESMLLVGGRIR